MADNPLITHTWDNHGELILTGSANAYVAAPARQINGYFQGLRICGKANFTNTGAATLNIISSTTGIAIGAVAIRKDTSSALVANDMKSGQYYDFMYDATNGWFQLLNPSPSGAFQPLDSDLTAIAALSTTAFGRSLLTQADAAAALATLTATGQGKHSIWVPAISFSKYPSAAGKPDDGSIELSSLNNYWPAFAMDPAGFECLTATIAMPKSWNLGNISGVIYWSHSATTTNFGTTWQLAAHSIGDNETLNFTLATAASVSDTGGTTNNLYATPETSGFTPGGTPAAQDLLQIRVARVGTDGGDTLAVDARFHGLMLFYTTNAATDL